MLEPWSTSYDNQQKPHHLIQQLLRKAGIKGKPDAISLLGNSTSLVWRVTVDSQHYVIRQRTDQNMLMAEKELPLADLLQQHQALQTLSSSELAQVWYAVGTVYQKAHSIKMPKAGEIVGDKIEPFTNAR